MERGTMEGAAPAALRTGGRLLKGLSRLGRLPLYSPFGPPDGSGPARQGLLEKFQDHFSLVAAPLSEPISDFDKKQVAATANELVAGRVVDEDTLIEVRPLIPEEALCPQLARSALAAVGVVDETLREKHGLRVVRSNHPIMPVKTAGSPGDPRRVWQAIGDELDLLDLHARSERGVSDEAALVAVTEPVFARQIFNHQLLFDGGPLEDSHPMVLARVGSDPMDNVLAPVAYPAEGTGLQAPAARSDGSL